MPVHTQFVNAPDIIGTWKHGCWPSGIFGWFMNARSYPAHECLWHYRYLEKRVMTKQYFLGVHECPFMTSSWTPLKLKVPRKVGVGQVSFFGCLLRGANNRNTISLYYIPFQDNLGIIFPKFEVPSINDGSHRGEWILANSFKMVKFQSEKSPVLTPDLSRSWKSTIWKCLSFLEIPSGSASKMHLKT